jgi:hypothetical protein
MTALDLEANFRERVPELGPEIDREREAWAIAARSDEFSPDQFLGWVLVPYVMGLLQRMDEPSTASIFHRISALLEEFLSDENESVRMAVDVSFVESLQSSLGSELSNVSRHFGPRVRASFLAGA